MRPNAGRRPPAFSEPGRSSFRDRGLRPDRSLPEKGLFFLFFQRFYQFANPQEI
jgi:hypothetical protein